jgi:hypothetical protein
MKNFGSMSLHSRANDPFMEQKLKSNLLAKDKEVQEISTQNSLRNRTKDEPLMNILHLREASSLLGDF